MEKFVVRKKQKTCGDGSECEIKKRLTRPLQHQVDSQNVYFETKLLISEEEEKSCATAVVNSEKCEVSAQNDSCPSMCMYKNVDINFISIKASTLKWQKIKRDNLDLDYTVLFPYAVANSLIRILEEEIDYFKGDLAKVKVFGKWHDIPRKQATYGDPGLTYKYSGIQTPARPWPRSLEAIRDLVNRVSRHQYNFVLVNRYKDGSDKMGEHKDDEKDLDSRVPIASVSLGQPRDFYFRHQDTRPPKKMNIEKVSKVLENGSLLLMNPPTNNFWYHALPPRKSAPGLRINLTFRKVVQR